MGIGIDQQVNAIGDPAGRERYIAVLREFCSDAKHRRVSAVCMCRIKKAIVENCGVELNEEQCLQILAGVQATFARVAEQREAIATVLPNIGKKNRNIWRCE